jgi:hypothetical protein
MRVEDLAVTAMRKILAEVLEDRNDQSKLAEALIAAAQDVRFFADTGRLEVVFVREGLRS